MSDGLWNRLLPRRARVGLTLSVIGWAMVAFAHIDRQFIWSHPVIRSSEQLGQAYFWFLGSHLPRAIFLGGWAMVLLGFVLTAQALFGNDAEPARE
jgi:hypothetical protein